MGLDLRKRHFLTLDDFTSQEIDYLLQLSAELKAAKYAGKEEQRLRGKNIALIFEKDSTRTRCAFEVAAFDQGAHVTYIGSSGSHIGYKETMKDTARVLGRMYHGIQYRGAKQATVEELARYSGVPVWNGLTAEAHPTQALADLLTAVAELLAYPETPRAVVINESLEIARKFSSPESVHFVNGVLDSVGKELEGSTQITG